MSVSSLHFGISSPMRLGPPGWMLRWGLWLLLTYPASGQVHGDQIHGDQVQVDPLQGDQLHGDQLHGDQLHGDHPDYRLMARTVSLVWPAERVRRSVSDAASPASVPVVAARQPALHARSTPVSTGTDYATEPDVFIREQRMQRPTAALLNETYRQAEANWSQHLRSWQAICARNGRYRP